MDAAKLVEINMLGRARADEERARRNADLVAPLQTRIDALETENAALRRALADAQAHARKRSSK